MTASGELCERCGENVVALNDIFCARCVIEVDTKLADREYWLRRALERKTALELDVHRLREQHRPSAREAVRVEVGDVEADEAPAEAEVRA